ncbi:MAG: glycosyltransferase [Trichodesmium sp.]
MKELENIRVAWLLPSLDASYWQPVLKEFTELYPQTIVYTGKWSGFIPGFENSFKVELVGKTKIIEIAEPSQISYTPNVTYVSPTIVNYLLKFRPKVIFTIGFSIWTILILLFKPWGKWRVIIAYEGSSPKVDYRDSKIRTVIRRILINFVDAFITNNQRGKSYLTEFLGVQSSSVFARPYEVPDTKALLIKQKNYEANQLELSNLELSYPVFLFIGQIIPRKGINLLLEACSILQKKNYDNYSLLIIGEGSQRVELELFTKNKNLSDNVHWIGQVKYDNLGTYLGMADVFILPTLEDTWGMVVLEAMALGKPVLCSKWAGASEMVLDGENGYIFDSHYPQELAELMIRFIHSPELTKSMGEKSQELIYQHTPEIAANFLSEVISFVLKN